MDLFPGLPMQQPSLFVLTIELRDFTVHCVEKYIFTTCQ